MAVPSAAVERQVALSSAIAAAATRSEVLTAMEDAAEAFGFAHVTLMAKPGDNDEYMSRLIIQTTLPEDFVRQFDRNRFLVACPVMPTLFETMLPQAWTLEGLERDGIVPAPITRLMRRFSLFTTVVMPLHSFDGARFLLRFDGKRPSLRQSEINEFAVISLHAFEVFDRIRRTEEIAIPRPLSMRELEVVRWTAQGKTSVEIGRILSLSDHTINAHLTNAIKKLDCVNRTQLVAKAIRLGLIP